MKSYITSFLLLLLLIGTPVFSNTHTVGESGYEAFSDGTFDGVSLNQGGKLGIAPKATLVADLETSVAWKSVEDGEGGLYISAGSDGRLIHLDKDGEKTDIFVSKSAVANSLELDAEGNILYAVGPPAVVYKITREDRRVEVLYRPEAEYIWQMHRSGNLLYLTTGSPAKLEVFDLDSGEATVLFKADDKHFTELLVTETDIYVSGSPKGIVYKIDKSGEGGAFFNAGEKEINGLGLDDSGNLIVAGYREKAGSPRGRTDGGEDVIYFLEDATENTSHSEGNGGQNNGKRSSSKVADSGILYQVSKDGYALPLWSAGREGILSLGSMGPYWLVGLESNGALYGVRGRDKWQRILSLEKGGNIVQILNAEEGGFWVLTSQPAAIYKLGGQTENAGTYTSSIVDIGQQVLFGSAEIVYEGGRLEIGLEMRSGNSESVDSTWTEWAEIEGGFTGNHWRGEVASPSARYLQYRVTLEDENGEGGVYRTRFFVRMPNLPPVITQLLTLPGLMDASEVKLNPRPLDYRSVFRPQEIKRFLGNRESSRLQFSLKDNQPGVTLIWSAVDPNQDELEYAVFLQPIAGNDDPIILESGIESPFVAIPTSGLEEGYHKFILEAQELKKGKETPLKAYRESDVFLIDSTAPKIEVSEPTGGQWKVTVSDDWSIISKVSVIVQGEASQVLEPEDGFNDETLEVFTLAVPSDYIPGTIQIQAEDESGHVSRFVL